MAFFKFNSINSRLITGTVIVISLFMVLTGLTLSKTFYDSAYSAVEDRLTGQVYLLMADRDITSQSPAPSLQDEKETATINPSNTYQPNYSVYSQLSGFITQADGTILWQSDRGIELRIPPSIGIKKSELTHGKKIFQKYTVNDHQYISLSIAIFWDLKNPRFPLIYHISDDMTQLNQNVSDYQLSLWSNLLLMSFILIFTLFFILRWGLKPLREVEKEIKSVEQGEQEQLEQNYPEEITPLSQNINALILFERQQQLRYRNALADLAHSLKTPLAIIQGHNTSLKQPIKTQNESNTIKEAVERMNSIIEYQLQRASSNSPSSHIQYLKLAPIVKMLLKSMKKIYCDKNIQFKVKMAESVQFKIDEGDFMEIVGNLLDNACKWCKHKVSLSVNQHVSELEIQVLDDGPGIDFKMISEITKRGVRADELTPGHGVGLAIVQDIASNYQGEVKFDSSENGLKVTLKFS
ncbi:MAG: GHKL domain-containing protein [Gammaproteobacteria bacterium]|nr:GHKL domain-containing protein [Gammaproteobacteria bacterium]